MTTGHDQLPPQRENRVQGTLPIEGEQVQWPQEQPPEQTQRAPAQEQPTTQGYPVPTPEKKGKEKSRSTAIKAVAAVGALATAGALWVGSFAFAKNSPENTSPPPATSVSGPATAGAVETSAPSTPETESGKELLADGRVITGFDQFGKPETKSMEEFVKSIVPTVKDSPTPESATLTFFTKTMPAIIHINTDPRVAKFIMNTGRDLKDYSKALVVEAAAAAGIQGTDYSKGESSGRPAADMLVELNSEILGQVSVNDGPPIKGRDFELHVKNPQTRVTSYKGDTTFYDVDGTYNLVENRADNSTRSWGFRFDSNVHRKPTSGVWEGTELTINRATT